MLKFQKLSIPKQQYNDARLIRTRIHDCKIAPNIKIPKKNDKYILISSEKSYYMYLISICAKYLN